MRTLADYLALVPSQHQGKPKYMATLELVLAPQVAMQEFINNIPQAFDLDEAIGVQLDIVGQWIGATRYINAPINGIFFSFDTSGQGFDQAIWFGPFTPTQGLIALYDDLYREFLYAKAAANEWNGELTSAWNIYQMLLAPYPGAMLLVQDNQDMTMTVAIGGTLPPVLVQLLVLNEHLPLRPSGVQQFSYLTSVPGAPLFGFDVETALISGLDVGSIAVPPSVMG
jgi:hypothetical protein